MWLLNAVTGNSFVVDAKAFEESVFCALVMWVFRRMSLAINFLDFVVKFGIFFEQLVDDMLVFLSLSSPKRVIFNNIVTTCIPKILKTQFFN
jgi:hypothetical protein